MLMMLLFCAQAVDLEAVEAELGGTWGPLLYEVETARLAIDDFLSETKRKELPDAFPLEEQPLWRFRFGNDLLPRYKRILALAKGVPLLAGVLPQFKEHVLSWEILEPQPGKKAPFPDALVEGVREGYAAAKKKHAALLAKDRAAGVRWMERQIKELYEPLLRLNAQGLAAVRGYTKLNPDDLDQARWKVWAEREMLPRNEETRRVLAAGFGLLEGEGPSDSVRAFLIHQHSWALRHQRWLTQKGDYEWGSRTNWPVDFSKEVEAAYQALLDRRARLALPE